MLSLILTLILFVGSCVPLCAQKRPAPAAKKTSPAAAIDENKRYPIAELTAKGSERFDAEEILKATGLKKDKALETPLDDVKVAAQKLIDSGVFTEVNFKHTAAPGGMKVEFTVADKDDNQFMKCDFANIVWLGEQELLIELHDRLPLFNGTVPRDGALTGEVAKALQEVLKEHGVTANVATEHQDPVNGEASTETMTYRVADIDIRIAKVELSGASEAMQAEGDVASKQIIGLVYNRATVKRFIERNLRNVFLRRGRLRAAFGAPEVKALSESGGVTNVALTIPVTEGPVYKAGAVRWTGNKKMSPESLNPYLHLTRGTILDGAQLAKDIEKLRYHYATLGYLRMTLTPRPVFDDNAAIVNYEMPIHEGDLFSMGKFDVEGLQPASAEKVRLAWKLREGDSFDPSYIKDFFAKFRMPANTEYIIDEVEGETPKSVDVTVIFCVPGAPCKPKNENRLYTPPAEDEGK